MLLLPTQAFFYFMAIETLYKCELDKRAYLQLTETNCQKGNLTIELTDHNISNMVVLTKYDVKKLIQELNEWVNL